MANDINSCNFSGNLVRDPELRMTAGGTPILNFSIAVNTRKLVNGEWVDQPNFPRLVMFGKRAESLSAFLRKGSKVFVTCKLRESAYERDGRQVRATEFVVDELVMTGSKKQGPIQYAAEISDEEIPF